MAPQRPNTRMILAAKLKALMEESGMTQRELASKSGVSQRQISNIVRGENSCSVEIAEALAKPFGLTGWQLIAPNIPAAHKYAPALNRLVSAYALASDDVRNYFDSIVDREKKLATNSK